MDESASLSSYIDRKIGKEDSEKYFLRGLSNLVSKCQKLRRQNESAASIPINNDSSSEDDSVSSDSSEDEGFRSQNHQTKFQQDLQHELNKLEISEEASTLETMILIVEHYVKTGDIEGFKTNVRRPDAWLLSNPRPKISDLTAMAEDMQRQNLHFRAVMINKAICALYKYEYNHHPGDNCSPDMITPDAAITGIAKSIERAFNLFFALESNESDMQMYLPHFIPIMYDMLTNLREIRHANRKYRADCEAWAILQISIVHGMLSESIEMKKVILTNIETIEKRFKKKAKKHVVYGLSYLSLAVSHQHNQQDFDDDTKMALEALQESNTVWEKKVELVKMAKNLIQEWSKD